MTKLTKKELSKIVSDKLVDIPAYKVEKVIAALIEAIGDNLISGNKIILSGLGTFETSYVSKSKKILNGDVVRSGDRHKVKFTLSDKMKDKVAIAKIDTVVSLLTILKNI